MTKLQKKLVQICGKHPHAIRGGRAKGKSVLDFDPNQVWMGIKVELEHTGNKRLACEIATDHLTEHKSYYTRLRRAKL